MTPVEKYLAGIRILAQMYLDDLEQQALSTVPMLAPEAEPVKTHE